MNKPAILGGNPTINRSEIQKWPRNSSQKVVDKVGKLLSTGSYAMGSQTEAFEKNSLNIVIQNMLS